VISINVHQGRKERGSWRRGNQKQEEEPNRKFVPIKTPNVRHEKEREVSKMVCLLLSFPQDSHSYFFLSSSFYPPDMFQLIVKNQEWEEECEGKKSLKRRRNRWKKKKTTDTNGCYKRERFFLLSSPSLFLISWESLFLSFGDDTSSYKYLFKITSERNEPGITLSKYMRKRERKEMKSLSLPLFLFHCLLYVLWEKKKKKNQKNRENKNFLWSWFCLFLT